MSFIINHNNSLIYRRHAMRR